MKYESEFDQVNWAAWVGSRLMLIAGVTFGAWALWRLLTTY